MRRAGREIARQLQGAMGPDAGLAVAALLGPAAGPGGGAGPLGAGGVVVLVLGATAVFIQLQEALNRVWKVAPRPGSVFRSLLKKRLVSFGLVLMVGFLLFASLVLSAGLMALTDVLTPEIPLRLALVTPGKEVFSFLVLAVLFALVLGLLRVVHPPPRRRADGRVLEPAQLASRVSGSGRHQRGAATDREGP